MQRTGRGCVRELPDDVADPKPDYLTGGVASCPELIGMASAFLPGPVAMECVFHNGILVTVNWIAGPEVAAK